MKTKNKYLLGVLSLVLVATLVFGSNSSLFKGMLTIGSGSGEQTIEGFFDNVEQDTFPVSALNCDTKLFVTQVGANNGRLMGDLRSQLENQMNNSREERANICVVFPSGEITLGADDMLDFEEIMNYKDERWIGSISVIGGYTSEQNVSKSNKTKIIFNAEGFGEDDNYKLFKFNWDTDGDNPYRVVSDFTLTNLEIDAAQLDSKNIPFIVFYSKKRSHHLQGNLGEAGTNVSLVNIHIVGNDFKNVTKHAINVERLMYETYVRKTAYFHSISRNSAHLNILHNKFIDDTTDHIQKNSLVYLKDVNDVRFEKNLVLVNDEENRRSTPIYFNTSDDQNFKAGKKNRPDAATQSFVFRNNIFSNLANSIDENTFTFILLRHSMSGDGKHARPFVRVSNNTFYTKTDTMVHDVLFKASEKLHNINFEVFNNILSGRVALSGKTAVRKMNCGTANFRYQANYIATRLNDQANYSDLEKCVDEGDVVKEASTYRPGLLDGALIDSAPSEILSYTLKTRNSAPQTLAGNIKTPANGFGNVSISSRPVDIMGDKYIIASTEAWAGAVSAYHSVDVCKNTTYTGVVDTLNTVISDYENYLHDDRINTWNAESNAQDLKDQLLAIGVKSALPIEEYNDLVNSLYTSASPAIIFVNETSYDLRNEEAVDEFVRNYQLVLNGFVRKNGCTELNLGFTNVSSASTVQDEFVSYELFFEPLQVLEYIADDSQLSCLVGLDNNDVYLEEGQTEVSLPINYELSSPNNTVTAAHMTVTIYNKDGAEVKQFEFNSVDVPTEEEIAWMMQNTNGELLTKGDYTVEIKAEKIAGSNVSNSGSAVMPGIGDDVISAGVNNQAPIDEGITQSPSKDDVFIDMLYDPLPSKDLGTSVAKTPSVSTTGTLSTNNLKSFTGFTAANSFKQVPALLNNNNASFSGAKLFSGNLSGLSTFNKFGNTSTYTRLDTGNSNNSNSVTDPATNSTSSGVIADAKKAGIQSLVNDSKKTNNERIQDAYTESRTMLPSPFAQFVKDLRSGELLLSDSCTYSVDFTVHDPDIETSEDTSSNGIAEDNLTDENRVENETLPDLQVEIVKPAVNVEASASGAVDVEVNVDYYAYCQYKLGENFVYGEGVDFTSGQDGEAKKHTASVLVNEGSHTLYVRCQSRGAQNGGDNQAFVVTYPSDDNSDNGEGDGDASQTQTCADGSVIAVDATCPTDLPAHPTIQLSSTPSATSDGGSDAAKVELTVGDTIEFKANLTNPRVATTGTDYANDWDFDSSVLNCGEVVVNVTDANETTKTCTVLAAGDTDVQVTTSIGAEYSFESNTISIIAVAAPAPTSPTLSCNVVSDEPVLDPRTEETVINYSVSGENLGENKVDYTVKVVKDDGTVLGSLVEQSLQDAFVTSAENVWDGKISSAAVVDGDYKFVLEAKLSTDDTVTCVSDSEFKIENSEFEGGLNPIDLEVLNTTFQPGTDNWTALRLTTTVPAAKLLVNVYPAGESAPIKTIFYTCDLDEAAGCKLEHMKLDIGEIGSDNLDRGELAAGEYNLFWDGADSHHMLVPNGYYNFKTTLTTAEGEVYLATSDSIEAINSLGGYFNPGVPLGGPAVGGIQPTAACMFNDVPENDPDFLATQWACQAGIYMGTGDGLLNINGDLNRVDFIAVANRLAQCPATTYNASSDGDLGFSDLDANVQNDPNTQWWLREIKNASQDCVSKGQTINGYADGTIKVGRQLSAAEMWKVVIEAAKNGNRAGYVGFQANPNENPWYRDYENLLVANGISIPAADRPMTRRDSIRLLFEMFQKGLITH